MNTEEIFKQSGYTIPTDKHDECSKRFDYWDMIAFADLVIEKQQPTDSNLSQHLVIGMWHDYDDIDSLPHGEYKVRTNFSNEKIGEFFNEEWLDAKNSFDIGELVLEYYR